MDAYFTLRGTSRRKQPVLDYQALMKLSHREAPDDGKVVPLSCNRCATLGDLHTHCTINAPPCDDCKRGTLQWAEAGYTPWHRICNTCGSHWSIEGDSYQRARFYR